MPNNVEAERSVLGAILLDNAALLGAREFVTPEDFFASQHVHIFGHMIELHDSGLPIDLVILTDRLHRASELEMCGGAMYLAALADGMPKVSNIGHYARIVKETAVLRQLIHFSHNIQQNAFAPESTASEIMDSARATLTELASLQVRRGPVAMKVIVRNHFAALEKIVSEGRLVTGVATGYSELDKLLAGLQPSELIILAARPSIGKSSLALNIAENIAVRRKQPVLLFSLEMSEQALLMRMLSSMAQVDAHKFRTGHLAKEDWRRLTEKLAELSETPLWIDDSSTLTVSELGARAERVKKEHGLALLVVDYLQLLGGSRRYSNRQEEVSEVSRGLKAVAKDLGIPLLALSQLRRPQDKEERQPQLSDLRESGAIEQDADVVLFIHRPKFYKKDASPIERDESEIIVGKQRNGPTDSIRFVFRSNITRFEEAAPESFGFSDPEPGYQEN